MSPLVKLVAYLSASYFVGEVADLLSVHKNTVRLWVKNGLATNDNKRPILILGSDLRQFLQSKRNSGKRKCQPFEIYCVRCRIPQVPAGKMADYEPINSKSGRLIGLCPTCGGIINKYFSFANLGKIIGKLDVKFTKALEHLYESN